MIIRLIILFIFPWSLLGQVDCEWTLKGQILDRSTQEPLVFAHIYVDELETGAVTDESGFFSLENLCSAGYHLRISHIGCDQKNLFVEMQSDSFLNIYLDHHDHVLQDVHVDALTGGGQRTEVRSTLDRNDIQAGQGQEMAQILEKLPGVGTLQTGSGIVKPVIHGLSGQRLAIVQDGLNLTGQRWASGHAPEVDVMGLESISVVKGAAALEYGGEGLGGAILLNHGPLPTDPHWHGQLQYGLESNGWGHHLSTQWNKRHEDWAYRIFGGGGWSGNRRASSYLLTNTGKQSASGGLTVFKEQDAGISQWKYTYFYNNLGILRGSLISNTSDLELALERDVPFFTEDQFTYDIASPQQEVQHHTLAYTTTRSLSDHASWQFQYGGQWNERQEYDLRRGGRSDIPALDLRLMTHQVKTYYLEDYGQSSWKIGLQHISGFNRNDENTGILPLLPDYNSFQTGSFFTFSQKNDQWMWDAGVRYDHRWNSVALIEQDVNRTITRYRRHFHTILFSLGLGQEVSSHFNWALNLGASQRAPGINELYSSGLHQGVASIEEGNPDLQPETGWKGTLRFRWHSHDHFWVEASTFAHWVSDFIYLRPDQELRLTIRGAYPVFRYVQSDALLWGMDLNIVLPIGHRWEWTHTLSYLYGQNRSDETPLIFMPQNNWRSELSWEGDGGFSAQMNVRYYWEQLRFPEEQDFADPPPGYLLVGAGMNWETEWGGQPVHLSLEGENILNESYRNYLNRWRYFADDLGVNVRAKVSMDF